MTRHVNSPKQGPRSVIKSTNSSAPAQAVACVVVCLATWLVPAGLVADPPTRRATMATARTAKALDDVRPQLDQLALLVVRPETLSASGGPAALRKAHPHLRVVALMNVRQSGPRHTHWKLHNANPTWFYHDKNRQRVRVLDAAGGAGRAFAMNLADRRYRTWCLQQVVNLRRLGYDGVLVEGIGPLDSYTRGRVSARPVTAVGDRLQELGWEELFADGLGLVASLRKGTPEDFPIYLDGVHAAAPKRSARLLQHVDGALLDPPVVHHGDVVTNLFEARLELAATMVDKKQLVLLRSSPSPDARDRRLRHAHRLALAGMLLMASEDTVMDIDRLEPGKLNRMVQALGDPTGPARRDDAGRWRRRFVRGTVEVNPQAEPVGFDIHLNVAEPKP